MSGCFAKLEAPNISRYKATRHSQDAHKMSTRCLKFCIGDCEAAGTQPTPSLKSLIRLTSNHAKRGSSRMRQEGTFNAVRFQLDDLARPHLGNQDVIIDRLHPLRKHLLLPHCKPTPCLIGNLTAHGKELQILGINCRQHAVEMNVLEQQLTVCCASCMQTRTDWPPCTTLPDGVLGSQLSLTMCLPNCLCSVSCLRILRLWSL